MTTTHRRLACWLLILMLMDILGLNNNSPGSFLWFLSLISLCCALVAFCLAGSP